MITTKKGRTVIEGSINEILADVSIIIDSVNEALTEEFGAKEAKQHIMKAVERGFMSDDELQAKKKEFADKVACELTEALDELKKLIVEGMKKNGSK